MRRLILIALITLNGCSPLAPIGANEAAPTFHVEKVRWRRSGGRYVNIFGDVVNDGPRPAKPRVDIVARDREGAVISKKTIYSLPTLQPGKRMAFDHHTHAIEDPTTAEAIAY